MSFLTPVRNYVDALVHPSAQYDALMAARHRAFIAPRLLGSFAALASFPVYIAFRGVPSGLELGVFGWLVAPILIAYFLSRTGRYESAHVMSSLSLTGLVIVVAWCTGGIASFAAIWLVVVPLEAALSASRRVVALASIFALAAAGLLVGSRRARFAAAGDHIGKRAWRIGCDYHHLRCALRHRPGAWRRATHAHRRWAAQRRGGTLSPARAQHDRCHHTAWAQRRRAVRFAGGRTAVWRARQRACRPWAVRPRACDRPAGLSDRTGRRARRSARTVRSNFAFAATATRSLMAGISPGSKCAAARSIPPPRHRASAKW